MPFASGSPLLRSASSGLHDQVLASKAHRSFIRINVIVGDAPGLAKILEAGPGSTLVRAILLVVLFPRKHTRGFN